MSHTSSNISNTKLQMLWDIIPSSSIDVKVVHFLSSEKGDTWLVFAPLKKTVTPLLSTLVRVNIEDSPRIIYPFNEGEDIFSYLAMDRRTHII